MVKLLFIPHCLSEDYQIKISEFAEKKGYDVHVLGGGSIIPRILSKYELDSVEKFVGVACKDERVLAGNMAKRLNIEDRIVSVSLSKNGCLDTEVDLEELFSEL